MAQASVAQGLLSPQVAYSCPGMARDLVLVRCLWALLALSECGSIDDTKMLGMDANGEWWPVTIIKEHLDGTVACQVEDGFRTQWPIVHRANLKPKSDVGSAPEAPVDLQPDLQPEEKRTKIDAAPKGFAAAAAFSKVWQAVTGGLFKASDAKPPSPALAELRGDLALDTTLCHSHRGCKHLGTEGTRCCPTQDGVMLACCHDPDAKPEPAIETPHAVATVAAVQAPADLSAWVPVGAERADLIGQWGYGDGYFELALAEGQLRFKEVDARITGGAASGMVFINTAHGDAALPTARILAGGVEVAALRIRRLHGVAAGNKIGIAIMRSGDKDWSHRQEIIAARMPSW